MSNENKDKIIKTLYRISKLMKIIKFYKSQDAINLKNLKNKHLSKRCFIIGNGPSLKAEDLDKLKNEITFGFNRIYYIFNKTDWRPTYYCCQDDKTIFKSKEEINKLKIENKFFPINFPWDYKIYFNKAKYYILKQVDWNVDPNFSEDIIKGIYWGQTVAYTAIQLAVYMGIKEIYLLGVDHSFSKMENEKGEIVIDETLKDYFCEKYNTDKEDLYIPSIEVSTKAFISAKKYADDHNIKIYNATRGGKLEVFERVGFDNIIF